MDKKDFKGESKHIEPYRIIDEKNNDPLDNFFLVLAVVYNDLKGTILFEKLIEDHYRKPPIEETTAHAGEYAGIFVQTGKIRIANTREFFKFLKQNEKVLLSYKFQGLLSKTSKDVQARWADIINIAFERAVGSSEFINYLIRVRDNVGFHYNQSGKDLRKSFCNFFDKKEKIARNTLAYYSTGPNMEETRFYYADAAVGEYLRSTSGDTLKGFDPKYAKEMSKMIYDMNFAIMGLLKVYLKNRPKEE